MSAPMQLRQRQLAAIRAMLGEGDAGPISWKVLVFDEACRDLLAPLISVNALRRLGVTLPLVLDAPREPLGDVNAVYFCRATDAAVERIAADAEGECYARMDLHFCGRTPRKVLEKLARALASSPNARTPAAIGHVWDEHLEFTALEDSLFTLGLKRSFVDAAALLAQAQAAGGKAPAAAADGDDYVGRAARGLFSVCATLGAVPVVRCARGGPAEAVARAVCALLADHADQLKGERAQPAGDRPLLVIVDRCADVATPLRHTETYHALLDDVLDHAHSKVAFVEADGKKHDVELSMESDAFFATYAARSFPDVIDASSAELSALRDKERDVRARAGGGEHAGSKGLADAVGELPALLERKRLLEAHTRLLGAVMKRVVAREVPRYYEAEEAADDAALDGLLGVAGKGAVNDKLRLLLVRGVAADDDAFADLARRVGVAPADAAQLRAGLAAVAHARALARRYRGLPTGAGKAGDAQAVAANPKFANFLATAQAGTASLLDKAAKNALRLLAASASPGGLVTKVLTNLFEARPGSEHETYLYLDPKAARGSGGFVVDEPPAKCAALGAVVFVVGGGCYCEHHALQAAFGGARTVVYGATELFNADQFLAQLAMLPGAQPAE
ncbi:Sec1-like protein [Pelagophyceae sp. CCMP2097]|nr:Sec1-like protein [Pelagophyceae sp. CCMP2097]